METLQTPDITENSDPFRDLVVRDLKYRHDDRISPAERASLRTPENLPLWLDTLTHLRREMEVQYTERRAAAGEYKEQCLARGYSGKSDWFRYKDEYDAWRARGNRFTTLIKARIDEAKRLLREEEAKQADYRRLLREALCILREARCVGDAGELIGEIEEVLLE